MYRHYRRGFAEALAASDRAHRQTRSELSVATAHNAVNICADMLTVAGIARI